MNYTFEQYRHSADFLRARLGGFSPKIAMILGSGLGYLGDLVKTRRRSPTEIFRTSRPPPPPGIRADWSSARWRASRWP